MITSPNYPHIYPAPIVCTYRLIQPLGRVISLSVSHIDLGRNDTNHCTGRLDIYDGDDVFAPMLDSLSGIDYFMPSRVINSTANALFLRLETCSSFQENIGFHALYNTIDLQCGGLFKENNGTVRHPAHNTVYNNNEDCQWTIQAPPGETILLDFQAFETEPRYDYVSVKELYAGRIVDLGSFNGTGIIFSPIATRGRIMYVNFHSDLSGTRTGFIANYAFLTPLKLN